MPPQAAPVIRGEGQFLNGSFAYLNGSFRFRTSTFAGAEVVKACLVVNEQRQLAGVLYHTYTKLVKLVCNSSPGRNFERQKSQT